MKTNCCHNLDLCRPRLSTQDQINAAIDIVDRSGLAPVLDGLLVQPTGRPRRLKYARGPLIGFALNGLHRHHRGHITEAARVITGLTDDDRARCNLEVWDPHRGYEWIRRFVEDLSDVLADGPEVSIDGQQVRLNHDEFLNRMLRAAIPPKAMHTTAIALDGTAIETWGALYGDPNSIEEDPPEDHHSTRPAHLRSRNQRRSRLKVHGTGPDGRKVYTHDPHARAGHRTATNSRAGGSYIGYELHLATQVRSLVSTNFVDETKLGPVPPGFILGATIRPAGTHRGASTTTMLAGLREAYPMVTEVLADPGYTLLKSATFMIPVRVAGYDVTFEPILRQRSSKPTASGALLLEGGYYSEHLPNALRGIDKNGRPEPLPRAPRNAPVSELVKFEEAFNMRARYRYNRHSRPDSHGNMRMRCPFCAGRLRSRTFPRTMRLAHHVPLVHIDGTPGACCAGSTTVSAAESALWQPIPAFTTAWRLSYGRRSSVEATNGGLKDQFVTLGQGFTRVLDMRKLNVLMAFTLAGFNHNRGVRFEQRAQPGGADRRGLAA